MKLNEINTQELVEEEKVKREKNYPIVIESEIKNGHGQGTQLNTDMEECKYKKK
ncbi:MAG: hypothetical protein ACRCXY_00895 [Fusobacteriaceae bacterium]